MTKNWTIFRKVVDFVEMLDRLRCRAGIRDFYNLFVPAESTQQSGF